MRDLTELDRYRVLSAEMRITAGMGNDSPSTRGAFIVEGKRILASAEGGWDHVSVSRNDRCPTWEEMERVKRLFFRPEEVVMQLHVAESNHRNFHPYCLHLWRPHYEDIPLPPPEFVA